MPDTNTPETTEQAATPTPGSDEYNQMMADRFRNEGQGTDSAADDQTPSVPAKPDGGHDKFYNAETGIYNWEGHAKEAMYRQEKSGDAGETNNEADEQPEGADENAGVSDIITQAGLDPQDLEKQIFESGTISDEARSALNKQGIPDHLIDTFASNHKAQYDAALTKGLDYVGGADEWTKVKTWAKDNLSAGEQESFQTSLNGDGWQLAVDGIKARMSKAKPGASEGQLTVGNTTGSQAPVGYTSRAQMQKDMSDPRYSSDPAFQRSVVTKMQNATWSDDGGSLF